VTFPLTIAGRYNLEAILAEFERAGRIYPPLHHELLIGWSESGEVYFNEAQWQAFMDAEPSNLDESEWSEWDGPHSGSPGFGGEFLGRWYGNPGGQQEFINLAAALTAILDREDFSSVDNLALPFAFGSWVEWLSTIHFWASRFQLPLLSSDLGLWGVEDSDADEFYELTEKLNKTGDVSWPPHPLKWSLTFNVFTSSAAAIRAILRPNAVIAFNEPWPYSEIKSNALPPGGIDVIPTSSHRIVHDQIGWYVHFADSPRPVMCKQKAGLHRMAVLIQRKGSEVEPSELSQYGARQEPAARKVHKRECVDGSDGLTVGKSPFAKQEKDDEEARRRTQERLDELSRDRKEALRDNNATIIAEIDDEIRQIAEEYNVNENFKVKSQRPFRDLQEKKAYDSVAATIRNAIKELRNVAPQHLKAINELEDQIRLPKLIFVQNEKFTSWVVEQRN